MSREVWCSPVRPHSTIKKLLAGATLFCLLLTVWASSESPPDRGLLVISTAMALALTAILFALSERALKAAAATAEDAFLVPIVRWLFIVGIGLQVCGVGALIWIWRFQ